MKIYLAALLISFFLVAAYSVLDGVLYVVSSGSPMFLSDGPISLPLRLPRTVYEFAVPAFIQDTAASSPLGSTVERLVFFVLNIFLYSIPVFVMLRLFFKPKKAA